MSSSYYYNVLKQSTLPFSNQYSMAFDGVDDYVDVGNLNIDLTTFSVSCWFKGANLHTGVQKRLFDFRTTTRSSNKMCILFNGTSAYGSVPANSISVLDWSSAQNINTAWNTNDNDKWNNVVLTVNNTNLELFLNGVSIVSGTITRDDLAGIGMNIGSNAAQSNYFFPGEIDETAIFDYTLTTQNASDIYNDGIPTDLTSLSPIAWYRMGDSATWKSPQWLLPSNENKDKVSNYSMAFDGVDDYINLGTDSSLDIFGGDFTISLWAKWGAQTTNSNGIVSFGANSDKAMVGLGFSTNYGKITFATPNLTPNGALYDMGSGYDDNQWHNIICTFSGNSPATYFRAVYVDGVDITSTASISNLGVGNSNDIGVRDRGNQNRYFKGNIDDVSLFNRVVTNSERSILSTEPSDLTSLNPVSWYRMADNSTFSTNWTVPDEVGTNDGTSANMTIEDRIGDAPNSINNALSLNMDLIDRVEDTPPTP